MASLKCPYCGGSQDKVIDSREIRDGEATKRRRQCNECGKRFTTYEEIEERRLMVIKKDGRREPYDRGKILRGLQTACHKRNVDADVLMRITEEIDREIINRSDREVASVEIGEMVMARLRELDHVAYVRYASVYRQFRDVTQFRELVDVLGHEEREQSQQRQPRLPYER